MLQNHYARKALLLARAVAAGLATLLGADAALAQSNPIPATNMVTAPLVAPSAAWSFYGTATTHTTGAVAWTSAPPEISALSRALGGNRLSATAFTQNVFDYVRNNINTEFRFGLGKGARGAVIDQSGTPFDQAELMVKLLRQGGVSASYQVGTISLTAQQFGQWSGFIKNLNASAQTFDVDAQAACQFLADGAIPATVEGASSCSGLSGNLPTTGTPVVMAHIWVLANGNLYDPAFKRNTFTSGVDIANAMGCGNASAPTCGSTAISNLLQGSSKYSINGNPTYSNLNETAFSQTLTGYAQNIEAYIKSSNRTARLQDIVGGQSTDLTYNPAVGSTLPYPSALQSSWSGDVPDQYRTKFTIQVAPQTSTFFADESAGRQFRVDGATTSGNQTIVLTADNLTLWNQACGSNCTSPIVIGVTHPYTSTYADDTIKGGQVTFGGGFPKSVVMTTGESSLSSIKSASDLIASTPLRPDQETNAAQMLYQQSATASILSNMTQSAVARHHSIGLVWSGQLPISVPMSQSSIVSNVSIGSKTNNSAARISTFQSGAAVWSMIEGSAFQQASDSAETLGAASMMVFANRNNVPLISVPHANMASLVSSGQLSNYTNTIYGDRTVALNAAAAAGYDFIIPQNGQGACVANAACVAMGPDFASKSGSLAYLMIESLKGGSDAYVTDPAQAAQQTVKAAVASLSSKKYAQLDLASGSVRMTPPPDIVTGVGSFPSALSLQRTYDSSAGVNETNPAPVGTIAAPSTAYQGPDQDSLARIGGGFVHNYQISARIGNNASEALGEDSGLDASAVVAGLFTLQNTLSQSAPTFEQQLAGFFVDYWTSKQFTYNSVSVTNGASTETFMRLPALDYNPPPGHAEVLTQSAERSSWFFVSGGGTAFDYSPINLSLTDKDGSIQKFSWQTANTYQSAPNGSYYSPPVFKIDNWAWPDGHLVTFNYIGNQYWTSISSASNEQWVLSSVTNNLGRKLTFTLNPVPTPNYPGGGGGDNYHGWVVTGVTDENNRQVAYALSGCPSGASFICNTLQVTTPDRHTSQYTYAAGSDSPDPSFLIKPEYHLRRWFVPSDLSTPFETLAYDDTFKAASITDKLAHTTRYFSGAAFPTENYKRGETLDAMSASSQSFFDHYSSLLSSSDPLNRTTTYAYDSARRKILETAPAGDATAYTYDVRSNILSTTKNPKPSWAGQLQPITTSTAYNEGASVFSCSSAATCNRPATTTDAKSAVTNYTWNSFGQLTKILKPADNNGNRPETDYTYSESPYPISILTQINQKVSTGNSQIISFEYNPSNKYVLSRSESDPENLNLITEFNFDPIGNLISMQSPRVDAIVIRNFVWDLNRRALFSIEPAPASGIRTAVKSTYDLNGELIEVDKGTTTQADGSDFTSFETTSFNFDGAGNKIAEIVHDGSGASLLTLTQYSYDLDDRPSCTAIRSNPAALASLSTPACSQGAAGSTGPDQITQVVYDLAGQKTNELRGVGTSLQQAYATYTYNQDGLQNSVMDANGNYTTQGRDGFNRPWRTYYPSATKGSGASDGSNYEELGYDANGNMTSLKKRDGATITYQYDALNREILKSVPAAGGASGYSVYTTYDLMDRPLAKQFGSTSGPGVSYSYDTAGRRLSETTNGVTLTSTYDGDANRTALKWPDGDIAFYVYDPLDRVSSAAMGGVTTNFLYDPLSRRSALNRTTGANTTYGYDNADRLTTLTHDLSATAADVTFGFSYTAASQVLNRSTSNASYLWSNPSSSTQNYAADGLNRDANLAASGGYDANGNLTSDGTRTFAYDEENHLVSVSSGGASVLSLTYDPTGRLEQTVSPTATTNFLYDSNNLVAELSSRGEVLRRYEPGSDEDEPLVWFEGADLSSPRPLEADRQGSIIGWSDSAGNGGGVFNYGPYGERSSWSGPKYAYTGQIELPEAKLYYYKARIYDPVRGWFLQADPVGYDDNLNLYSYVRGDPVNKADPAGLGGCATFYELNPGGSCFEGDEEVGDMDTSKPPPVRATQTRDSAADRKAENKDKYDGIEDTVKKFDTVSDGLDVVGTLDKTTEKVTGPLGIASSAAVNGVDAAIDIKRGKISQKRGIARAVIKTVVSVVSTAFGTAAGTSVGGPPGGLIGGYAAKKGADTAGDQLNSIFQDIKLQLTAAYHGFMAQHGLRPK